MANGTHASLHGVFPGRDILCNDEMYVNYFSTFFEVSIFSFQVHSEHLCSPTAHLGMWPQPPPGGFLVPPVYCPVSAEIICGPRRPLARQPNPQSSLLMNSEAIIEGGSVVSSEAPRNSKKEGRPRKSCKSSQKMSWRKDTVDPQLTESSDEEEKPSLTKFAKRKQGQIGLERSAS